MSPGGELTEAVRRKPYAVVLLDEMEKAHRDVSNLLLQLLDEGHLTDSKGRKVDFRNTIIIMTSNLGADALAMEADASGRVGLAARESVLAAVRHHFPPEFVNRVDELVIFNRLSRAALRDIVDVRLAEVQARLADRRIHIEADDDAKRWLADQGYDPVYGARPLNRLIQKQLLNPLAKYLIEGAVRNDETVRITTTAGPDAEQQILSVVRNHPPEQSHEEQAATNAEAGTQDGDA
ncbi:P-loop containing nucleoside triphosphate hydrolase protein [Thamnocephalis sphaerospora]|uniref:P-loop containing nucleoside triphosphate hydrolase protein n=1 Tax=Thamnocephalis sphaerospora TaxID=78915 RepID=A0A4P9XUR5_9FUNG|nr:P-loop containing nucleoside triphosphate hydrolase protein [Thamnocephalis sphaerospora]|eukprot:RKP09984.1 P-loop containing nucleoside triphosphate hydrolase protein [Thamnocephalis sphaerospora]